MEQLTVQQQNTVQYRVLTADLITDYVAYIDRTPATAKAYIKDLRQFFAYMKYANITQPTREDIINYRQYLMTEHYAIEYVDNNWTYRLDAKGNRQLIVCKPNTVALYIRSVCSFFDWLDLCGIYPNIARHIHTPKIDNTHHKKDALTAEEANSIRKSISTTAETKTEQSKTAVKDTAGRVQRSTEQGKRLYAMYLLTVTAGLRTIEISRAKVKDFEVKGTSAYLYIYGKGHSEADQKQPIALEVAEAIQDYLKSRTDGTMPNSPLFTSTGNRAIGKPIQPTTISKMLKKAMQTAGYDSTRLTAHSLRHTAGTIAQGITNNIYDTKTYMRHSNINTTTIYTHNEDEKKQAVLANTIYDTMFTEQN